MPATDGLTHIAKFVGAFELFFVDWFVFSVIGPGGAAKSGMTSKEVCRGHLVKEPHGLSVGEGHSFQTDVHY